MHSPDVPGGGSLPYVGDDPDALARVEAGLEDQREALAAVASRSAATVPTLRGAWRAGVAGDQAYSVAGRVTGFVESVPPALSSGSRAIEDYRLQVLVGRGRTDQLNQAHDALRSAENQVGAFGERVLPGNEAGYDRAVTDLRLAQRRFGFGGVADVLAEYAAVVRRVTAARDVAAAELTRLTNEQVLPCSVRPGMSLYAAYLAGTTSRDALLRRAGFTSIPTDPAEVARFWDSLAPTERTQLLLADPALWGNTNGVPCADRDWANRITLAAKLADLRALFARHGWPAPTSVSALDRLTPDQLYELGWGPKPGDLVNLDEAGQEQMAQYRAALATAATLELPMRTVQTYLLAFDPAAYHGEGRAAIAFGNPDLADNIAVCVPGLESRVSKIDQVGSDAYGLFLESGRADPTHTTATIAWQGYDAPEFLNVMHQDKADAGARILAQDVAALDLTHKGDPLMTVVAHSYGSTTTGLSLQRYGLADSLDQVVLIGSPGVGGTATSVADLHLRPDQLFVGSASRDLVTTTYGQLGEDPAMDTFGGVRFQAENVNRVSSNANPLNTADHSVYYDREPLSESMYAMSSIVTGNARLLADRSLLAVGRHRFLGGDIEAGYDYTEDPEWNRAPTTIPR